MTDVKVNPSNYDYVMYVDASGDDGFQFDNGSSICYCAAALLVKQEDIQHNLDILSQIKSIIGCKLTDEVKYSKIRRHRRGAEALGLLCDIKGRMSCYLIFKKELPPENIPDKGSKELSFVCHAMALRSLEYYAFLENDNILIAIDRMKHTEEAPLGEYLTKEAFTSNCQQATNFSHDVVFRDSKDSNFLLIQIADLLCGTVREHFEQYETNNEMLYFKSMCPKCQKVWFLKKGTTHSICKNGKSKAAKILHSKNFHNIVSLFPVTKGPDAFDYFFMQPINMVDQHAYLFCERI